MYKKIGIISRDEKMFEQKYKVFNDEIIKVIHNYNNIAIGIIVDFESNPELEFDKIKKIINFCDGIILQGGDDIYEIDQKIVKYLYDKNIPTLGICLGMQEMAVTMNGILKRLTNRFHKQNSSYVHKIHIQKESLLYDILKEEQIMVNSRHFDYIPYTNLMVGAVSDDHVIEEVEDKNKRFFLGVQWHPESISNDKNSILLFNYFFSTIKET